MNVYVASQPIFAPDGALFGYEFLYRNNAENRYDPSVDGGVATRSLLSSLMTEFGLDSLTNGTHAFVNFTRELLDEGYPYLFDPNDFIIEVLETVTSDGDILSKLAELKKHGYILALDDYTGSPPLDAMTELANILKVDFRMTSRAEQSQIARRFPNKRLLAEKVETDEDFSWALHAGYNLFQGYYFSRPVVLSKQAAELATTTYGRLWNEVRKPEPSFDELTQIIRADANLAYKLLARVNTIAYYQGHRIRSVKTALIQMGIGAVRRWILFILMRDTAGRAGDEQAKRSLIRAIFAESLVMAMGMKYLREDAYTAGLFSTIDLLLGGGMEELLEHLCVSDEVRMALLGGGGILEEVLTFIQEYEKGNWNALPDFIQRYKLRSGDIPEAYLRAVEQAESLFGSF